MQVVKLNQVWRQRRGGHLKSIQSIAGRAVYASNESQNGKLEMWPRGIFIRKHELINTKPNPKGNEKP